MIEVDLHHVPADVRPVVMDLLIVLVAQRQTNSG
jgi:hypothetical protein